MISHTHKCIFVHIPKCAGTSIENLLTPDINWWNEKLGGKDWNTEQHLSLHDMNQYSRYAEHLDNYFKFTFVRNPWDKFVSAFNFSKRFPASSRIEHTFKDFCLIGKDCWPTKSMLYRYYYDDVVGKSMYDYINSDETSMNFIGKFENLQQDFNIICDKIGIPSQELPHNNKSKHKCYTEYYDDETREIVAEKFAKDIEYFNYEFGK